MTVRRAPTILDSFNFAFEGIIDVLRTQRNLRIHFAIAFAVLILALIVDVTKLELIALLLSVSFVLIAEMLNTAVEAAIDIVTTSFDPRRAGEGDRRRCALIASSMRSRR